MMMLHRKRRRRLLRTCLSCKLIDRSFFPIFGTLQGRDRKEERGIDCLILFPIYTSPMFSYKEDMEDKNFRVSFV